MRKKYFYTGAIIVLIGIIFLSVPKPSADVSNPGLTWSRTLSVEPFSYSSFNVTISANVSVVVNIETRFGPGASVEAYARGEGCIDLLVVDEENYGKWLREENPSTYIAASGTHTSSFMFRSSTVAGIYHVILDNSWRCTEKIVTIRLSETGLQIFGGVHFQITGLGSLSIGSLVAIYGLAKEKAPTMKAAKTEGDAGSEEKGTDVTSPIDQAQT